MEVSGSMFVKAELFNNLIALIDFFCCEIGHKNMIIGHKFANSKKGLMVNF